MFDWPSVENVVSNSSDALSLTWVVVLALESCVVTLWLEKNELTALYSWSESFYVTFDVSYLSSEANFSMIVFCSADKFSTLK